MIKKIFKSGAFILTTLNIAMNVFAEKTDVVQFGDPKWITQVDSESSLDESIKKRQRGEINENVESFIKNWIKQHKEISWIQEESLNNSFIKNSLSELKKIVVQILEAACNEDTLWKLHNDNNVKKWKDGVGSLSPDNYNYILARNMLITYCLKAYNLMPENTSTNLKEECNAADVLDQLLVASADVKQGVESDVIAYFYGFGISELLYKTMLKIINEQFWKDVDDRTIGKIMAYAKKDPVKFVNDVKKTCAQSKSLKIKAWGSSQPSISKNIKYDYKRFIDFSIKQEGVELENNSQQIFDDVALSAAKTQICYYVMDVVKASGVSDIPHQMFMLIKNKIEESSLDYTKLIEAIKKRDHNQIEKLVSDICKDKEVEKIAIEMISIAEVKKAAAIKIAMKTNAEAIVETVMSDDEEYIDCTKWNKVLAVMKTVLKHRNNKAMWTEFAYQNIRSGIYGVPASSKKQFKLCMDLWENVVQELGKSLEKADVKKKASVIAACMKVMLHRAVPDVDGNNKMDYIGVNLRYNKDEDIEVCDVDDSGKINWMELSMYLEKTMNLLSKR